ncbi:MAG: hypothetical protein FJ189_12045, partial [Gammaproteobacteria bacterium]|nr:hypothetical protein [Gammaproteobacteria bacterium]
GVFPELVRQATRPLDPGHLARGPGRIRRGRQRTGADRSAVQFLRAGTGGSACRGLRSRGRRQDQPGSGARPAAALRPDGQ